MHERRRVCFRDAGRGLLHVFERSCTLVVRLHALCWLMQRLMLCWLMLGRRAFAAIQVAAAVATCPCACSSRSAVTRAGDELHVAPCLPGHCTLTDAQVTALAEQFLTDADFR